MIRRTILGASAAIWSGVAVAATGIARVLTEATVTAPRLHAPDAIEYIQTADDFLAALVWDYHEDDEICDEDDCGICWMAENLGVEDEEGGVIVSDDLPADDGTWADTEHPEMGQ
jgi:hypothetical protein